MTSHFISPDGQERIVDGQRVTTIRFPEAILKAQPGDILRLLPGVYSEPMIIEGKKASAATPISVIGDDGGVTCDGRRNHVRPPGLPVREHYAFIKILNSTGIVVENLTIQNIWPTAVYIEKSAHITLRRLNINGSSYAIFARDKETRNLVIEHNSWIQDERIWQEVLWKDIHQIPHPRRELDGDFFRSKNIKGNVIIRRNLIAQAFNGIHFFAEIRAKPGVYNSDVWIYQNTFMFIRDNAIEAEYSATNWWVYQNRIYNCHKWFAFEKCNGGYWYLFSNIGWFDRLPGPPGDEFSGGAVFKGSKVDDGDEDDFLPSNPVYAFHNSWYLRSAYIKKGKLRHFKHFNNAISYCDPRDHPEGVGDPYRKMFGSKLTTDWKNLDISFQNDVCDHREYPHTIAVRDKFPVQGINADPSFRDPMMGYFAPNKGSPLKGAGAAMTILLKRGRWHLPAGKNIGAVRGSKKGEPLGELFSPRQLNCPSGVTPD